VTDAFTFLLLLFFIVFCVAVSMGSRLK